MNISKDKIDEFLKNAKVGDRGYFNKNDNKEYFVAKKCKNTLGEYKNFVYLVSIEYLKNLKKALKDELGVMVNAEWINKDYDCENLFNKDVLRIDSIRNIKSDEIWFEDGIIIENGIINALTTLDGGKVEDIFGLKELNYDIDYYDVYLNFDLIKQRCEICIIAVEDENRTYYKYLPREEEKDILKKALEEYVKSYEGKSIQEILEDMEELEQE